MHDRDRLVRIRSTLQQYAELFGYAVNIGVHPSSIHRRTVTAQLPRPCLIMTRFSCGLPNLNPIPTFTQLIQHVFDRFLVISLLDPIAALAIHDMIGISINPFPVKHES